MEHLSKRIVVTLLVGAGFCGSAAGMTVSQCGRYGAGMGHPRSRRMAFYTKGEPDFLFSEGESVAINCQPLDRAVQLEWSLCHNLLSTPISSGFAEPGFDNGFAIEVPTDALRPGFYDLRVKVRLAEKTYINGIATFGWRVGEQVVVPFKTDDFEDFWRKVRESLQQVPLKLKYKRRRQFKGMEIDRYNAEMAHLPEHYDPDGEKCQEVEVYNVSFASAKGKRVYGWYAKPRGKGPFPGMLVLPGAGNRPIPIPLEQARHGYAALSIQVHGFPVDLKKYPPLPQDNDSSPEKRMHFPVYVNSLQAVNALAKLPGVEPNRLIVVGSSQGGRLAIVVAALDKRVKAAVCALTHYAYLPWHEWTQRLNLEKNEGQSRFTVDDIVADQRLQTASYLDVLNFAPMIECPVLMNCGLIDRFSPATAVYAVYHSIHAQKKMIPLPTMGHDWSLPFDRYAWRWLEEVMR